MPADRNHRDGGLEALSLYELDQEEWWDVSRQVMPGLTRDAFDEMWADFQACKREGRLKPAH